MNRTVVTASVALGVVGVLSASLAGAQARPRRASRFADEKELVVTLVTPTVNQEVLADLGDQGLNGTITVRFSSALRPRDVIDPQNPFNQLTEKFEFFNELFERLPGTPRVRGHIFTFEPFNDVVKSLPQGQYTLNIKSSVRNLRGSLLNQGLRDYTTTFSVATDIYPPVLRKISPINGQTNIGLFQRIVATFNEPIDPASIIGGTVRVEDASTNPPSPIPGAGGTGFTLERNGFDLAFTPDPCFGYPPKTTIQFIMQGQDELGAVTTATVADVFGNKFEKDEGLQWTQNQATPKVWDSPNGSYDLATGIFRMQFQSKGIKPQPVGLRPGSPQNVWPFFAPCIARLYYNVVHYTTSTGLGEIDLRAFIARWRQGITDFSLISVLPNTPVRLGRPAGVAFDPRQIPPVQCPPPVWVIGPNTFHTFIYVVDERTATVQVVRSDNLQVVGRFTGFSSPRDVSVATDGGQKRTTLYVSDFAANQVVAINLEGIKVAFGLDGCGNLGVQPGGQSPCDAIKDNQSQRTFIPVGRGPTAVAADSFLLQRVMVANTLDNSITMINVPDNKVAGTHDVGSNPVSLDWNTWQFGRFKWGLVANQGGLADPDGSLSVVVTAPALGGFFGAAQNRDGVEGTFTDQVKNPTWVYGNLWLDPPPPFGTLSSTPFVYWLVANTGGTTVMDMNLNISGLFGVSFSLGFNSVTQVGFNPTSYIPDPFLADKYFQFAAVAGTGQLAAHDPFRAVPPTFVRVPGLRTLATCFTK